MEKVKVSKDLYDALEELQKRCRYDYNKMLSIHCGTLWTLDIFKILNKISMSEMAELIVKGYELEKELYKKDNLPTYFKVNMYADYTYSCYNNGKEVVTCASEKSGELIITPYSIDEVIENLNKENGWKIID